MEARYAGLCGTRECPVMRAVPEHRTHAFSELIVRCNRIIESLVHRSNISGRKTTLTIQAL